MLSRADGASLLNVEHLHSNIRQLVALEVLELDYGKSVVSDVIRLKTNKSSAKYAYIPVDFTFPYEKRNTLTTDAEYDNMKQNSSTGSTNHDFSDLLAIWNNTFSYS
jgi:antitoxin component of RelBE/YafQ-DinJ toxin-antitoxin module